MEFYSGEMANNLIFMQKKENANLNELLLYNHYDD